MLHLVTGRGRVIAELRNPKAGAWTATPEQVALAKLAATGQLRAAEQPARPYSRSPLQVTGRGSLSRKLMDADRDE